MGTADERHLKALPTLLAVGVVAVPVGAGLLGTLLPAFGLLPALGGRVASLEPWRVLLAQPGLAASVRLTLTAGLGATVLSLLAVALFCAACHGTRWFRWLTLGAMLLWTAAEHMAAFLGARWAASGRTVGAGVARRAGLALPVLLALALLSLAAAALWLVAGPWRFPDAWPARLSSAAWNAQAAGLAGPFRTTLLAALAATALALPLAVAALEAVARHGAAARPPISAAPSTPACADRARCA